MSNVVDYATADIAILLADTRVQQLVKQVRHYPNRTTSEIVWHLNKSRKKPILYYKQVSTILQRLDLATASQRKLRLVSVKEQTSATSEPLLSGLIDYNTADIPTLLSDPYVQRLLETAQMHPDWPVNEMVSYLCLLERRYSTTLEYTYLQAAIIFRRLNLATTDQRKLRFLEIDKDAVAGLSRQQFSKTFPDLFFYLKHRKEYQEQTAADTLRKPEQREISRPLQEQSPQPLHTYKTTQVPAATSPSPMQANTPQYAFTPSEEATFKQFDRFFSLTKQFAITVLLSFLFFFSGSLLFDTLFKAHTLFERVGMFFSFTALVCGMFFFLYSFKYYFTIAVILSFSREDQEQTKQGIAGFFSRLFGVSIEITQEQTHPPSMQPAKPPGISLTYDLASIQLERQPFVSIHVATFNEKRVIDRFLLAATAMDYQNYEVIVADDSTDETVQLLEQWKNHPKVKISHRTTRNGFKGGALAEALQLTDPRAEFILVFDADFIPYPDAITQFVKYFQQCLVTSSQKP